MRTPPRKACATVSTALGAPGLISASVHRQRVLALGEHLVGQVGTIPLDLTRTATLRIGGAQVLRALVDLTSEDSE